MTGRTIASFAAQDRRGTVGRALILMLLAALLCGPASAQAMPERQAGASWLSEVQRQIRAAEYTVTWQDHTVLPDLERAWHAPNRAHDLRTYFTEQGIRVVRRTETEPAWELKLSLAGYGRGDVVRPVGEARLLPAGNRIDYERGPIVEWYVNDSNGLEQGFTLFEPPEEPQTGETGEPAFLLLELGGSLSPMISTDGQAIDFAAPGGAKVLHYAALKVTDAAGRELPARMEGFAQAGVRGIRIVFEDADAAYPVTVDPLLTIAAWVMECFQEYASFGYFVSTAGDVNGDGYSDVVVGAYRYDTGYVDAGRAFVYHGSAAGLSATADWTEDGDQAGAAFGRSVSTAGDVNGDGYSEVIVGAYLWDGDESNEGRAYVYHGSATGLSGVADWTADGDQAGASLGVSVATAGDVNGDGYSDVIVGAHQYDNPESNEGLALVYHGSAAGLSTSAAWTADGYDQISANFGWSVSTAGDVNGDGYADVIVGARSYDNPEVDEGGAWVYLGSASGLSGTAAWSDESDQAGARFGHSVSTAGDVNGDGFADVVVGNYRYTNDQTEEGRAQVYHGSPSGPSATPGWWVEGGQDYAYMGVFVSTAGDVNGDGYADLIVGAHGYDNPAVDEGRAFVYHGSPWGLSTVEDWAAEPDVSGAAMGASVSTAGDVNGDGYSDVIIGAPNYTDFYTEEGRAYVFHGSPAGLSEESDWSREGNLEDARFGWSVSEAGDVNGDGYGDLIIGAYTYDNGESDEGAAFVYHGSSVGVLPGASWSAEGNQAGGNFGFSVSEAGDVNGDGYDDVIVGARHFDSPESNEGRAFVYHGSPAGLSAVESWSVDGDQATAYFGISVSSAGDVNGDGYADVVVGAPNHDNGEIDEGRAYVYHGSPTGLSEVEDWSAEGDQAAAYFGISVSTAGDVNGDGYGDLIVGAYQYDGSATDDGAAFVYHGSATGLSGSADWMLPVGEDSAWFGFSVSTAGDVNGDGYADIIVGAPGYDYPELNEGLAFVFHGSAYGLSTSVDWYADSDQADATFGKSVSTAGDVNGDGYSDVIVGAEAYSAPDLQEGAAFLYHGSAAGLSTTADWVAEGNQAGAYYGVSVSSAGDMNGDGYGDVVVGADSYSNGQAAEGRALVYYGNASRGMALKPQQRRADDLAPIAAGGRSREAGSFRLAALGRTPFGRGRVRLEWEVKPLGQPFDGTGTGQSEWLDSGTAGAAFNELVTGLEPGAQHWRMRLFYDRATTPLQGASRWFGLPWNGWEERELTVSPFVGGTVWEDQDGDGIMETGELRLAGVLVYLLDGEGYSLQTTISGGDGSYRFDVGSGGNLQVRFVAPYGWSYTLQDQGIDDFVDSDADTVTGKTAVIRPPFDSDDEVRWSAGLRRVGICIPPDEPVYIYSVTLTPDGNDYPVLHFQDPNQPGDVTGYNVYRSSDPELPHSEWPLVADDVVDMDEAEPNHQWVDTSGDDPPGGTWYYQVAAYNHGCPPDTAEGPW